MIFVRIRMSVSEFYLDILIWKKFVLSDSISNIMARFPQNKVTRGSQHRIEFFVNERSDSR